MLRVHVCRVLANLQSSCKQRWILTPTVVNSHQRIRNCSKTASFVEVERDPNQKDVAWVRLNRKPVNSLNKQMIKDIEKTLIDIENDDSYRGIILTSAIPGIFSSGLEITEFYQKTPDHLANFWRTVQDLWLRFYGSPLAVIVALNGHSPAGGCFMALCCDYRIMAKGKYIIGLNEVLMGVTPPLMKHTMLNVMSNRHTERAQQLGTLFSVDEAVKVGLVDQAVPPENIEDAARAEMSKWLKIPDHARALTKQMLRGATIQQLQNKREEDIEGFVNLVSDTRVQENIGRYLESLKTRKK